MSVPGPVNILQSILEHNIDYIEHNYPLLRYKKIHLGGLAL